MSDNVAVRAAYGEALVKLGKEMPNVVVFDADVANATMTKVFRKEFPDRFFDMGIAEANMVCAAAGMADMGYIPFISAFSVFGIGRAYDQVRNTIAYGKNNVKLAYTHSGITAGEDGGSHQAIEDVALAQVIPHMTILTPCDATATYKALRAAAEYVGPVFVRMSRQPSPVYPDMPFVIGGSNVMRDGTDAVILTHGLMVSTSLAAAELLAKEGKNVAVVDMYSLKPLDKARVLEYAEKCKKIITVEENSIYGGLGDAVDLIIAEMAKYPHKRIGMKDEFGQSGKPAEMLVHYELDGAGIAKQVAEFLK